jgi:hypothetical protein
MRRTIGWAALCAALALGCGLESTEEQVDEGSARGKADGVSDRWELDLASLGEGVDEQVGKEQMTWAPLEGNDWRELFQTRLVLGPGQTVVSPSHLFGNDTWLPYADQGLMTSTSQGVRLADGSVDGTLAGDAELVSALCKNGEGDIGISLKHVSPQFRTLDPTTIDKEAMKLHDTHIQLWICVKDAQGKLRAITLNNPTNYAKESTALDGSGFAQEKVYGAFGTRAYGTIFLRASYQALGDEAQKTLVGPDGKPIEIWRAFHQNLRTMSVLFNSVSWFPVDYNGADPLAAYSPKTVRQHVAMMIHAVIGTAGARDWWLSDVTHYIYCAELAHLAASAALLVPLNQQGVVGLEAAPGFPAIGAPEWQAFAAELAKHNKVAQKGGALGAADLRVTYIGKKNRLNTGEDSTPFAGFRPGAISRIKLPLSPDGLKPFASYTARASECADPARADEPDCLAFIPLTVADMVQNFLAIYVPRYLAYQETDPAKAAAAEQSYAEVQAALLVGMKPSLYDAMALTGPSPQEVQGRAAVSSIIDALAAPGGVIRSSYPSYAAYQQALAAAPAMIQARALVSAGPKPSSFFSPPSLFHLAALKRNAGFLGLDYIAHGIHFSLMKKKATTGGNDPDPGVTVVAPCRDRSAEGLLDLSAHSCVDTKAAGFASTACAGTTVKGYCPGAASIQCCVL